MTVKYQRFSVSHDGKYTVFKFPKHEALMHFSRAGKLFGEGSGVSVFVGDAVKPRLNWKIRAAFTVDETVELTLWNSKEHKEVSVYIDMEEFTRNLIIGKKEFILNGPAEYRVWE